MIFLARAAPRRRRLPQFALVCMLLSGGAVADDGPSAPTGKQEKKQQAENKVQAHTLGKDQSGVFVNSTASNSGYSPSFVMRGFPSGLTLFDGAAHGFTSQDVDLSTVDHVEFYKGPGAMLLGKAPGGYGGAANYVRKTPTEGTFANAAATFGAFGVRRLTLDANAPLNDAGNLQFRVTGSAQTIGSFVDFVRARGFDIAPAVAFMADNGDRITLRAEHNASRLVWRDGVPADPALLTTPREFYAGVPVNEHETPFFDDVTLNWEHALNDNWRLTANFDYYLNASHFGWFTEWGYDGYRSIAFGQPVRTRVGSRNFDAQLRLNGRFDTGPFAHSAFLGLEHWDYYFAYSNNIGSQKLAPLDIFYPVYPPAIDYAGGYWSNGTARAYSQSVYAQDLIDLNEKWRILLGGRFDLLAQRERVFDPFGALVGQPTASLSKGVDGYFSPRAGVVFQPDPDTQIFAAFGESLVPNTGVRIQSGEAPPPQQDTQYEIGFKRFFPEGRMSFELGLFDITRDNVAIPNPLNPSGFYSVVTGQQHSHGVEANIGGDILPNLHVNAVATFLHAVVSKDSNSPSQQGSDLLGAPRRIYSLSATYKFDQGDMKGLELGASYYYASRAEATLPNTPGFTLAPQNMLGLSLAYDISDQVKLEASASNITNSPNFTSNGALYHGEPRGFSVSLNCKY